MALHSAFGLSIASDIELPDLPAGDSKNVEFLTRVRNAILLNSPDPQFPGSECER